MDHSHIENNDVNGTELLVKKSHSAGALCVSSTDTDVRTGCANEMNVGVTECYCFEQASKQSM